MSTQPTGRRYAKISAAAEQYDVDHKTIRRAIASGELTGYRLGTSRVLRVDLDELDGLMRPVPGAGGDAA
ncbi:MAG TPA: DNA-binding protein [Nocardioides sp.]